MMDGMTIAYVVDVETKDGKEVGLYGNKQAYLYENAESATIDKHKLEAKGYVARVKAVAMFPAEL